jgi:hypothetical protein
MIQIAKYALYLCRTGHVRHDMKLVMGSPYLGETVVGLKVRLLPTPHFWNNICGAEMVCKGVEELLAPTKKTSIVEVGFGLGLLGLHLSKVRMTNGGIHPLLLSFVT